MVGRLNKQKRYDRALRIAQQLKKTVMNLIYGLSVKEVLKNL